MYNPITAKIIYRGIIMQINNTKSVKLTVINR